MKKFLSMIFVVTAITVLSSTAVFAQGLFFDDYGIRYINADGTFATNCHRAVNGTAFHFGPLGYADQFGFDACAGKWKSTSKGPRYFFNDGRIPTGTWLLSDGHYYKFDDNGYMIKDLGSPIGTKSAAPKTVKKTTTSDSSNSSNSSSASESSSSASESSSQSESTVEQPTESTIESSSESEKKSYVLNVNTNTFHNTGCSEVSKISDEHRMDVSATRDSLISDGYKACEKCNP